MDKQSLFFTSIVAICAIVLLFYTISFISRKRFALVNNEPKVNTSYTIWLMAILIAFFIFLKPALEAIENTIEILIYSKTVDNTFWEVMQKIIVFVGFTFLFTFSTYFISNGILISVFGKRLEAVEMTNDNFTYFLIKGVVLLGLAFSILTVYQHLLDWFIPAVHAPFYH
ncbi:hypothetical protein [Flavobacterium agrisoli]|uniref:Uncharacterized protein n=1 Tax=Flavobacterium agrisoli TaxID=2793066 RepID=A0A934PMN2_9FLAO|nr:hypothetical protein [Flavobacterium agrisoli]MBK0370089.1 hypothetical protein [Flavobacterium agrisoli]